MQYVKNSYAECYVDSCCSASVAAVDTRPQGEKRLSDAKFSIRAAACAYTRLDFLYELLLWLQRCAGSKCGRAPRKSAIRSAGMRHGRAR